MGALKSKHKGEKSQKKKQKKKKTDEEEREKDLDGENHVEPQEDTTIGNFIVPGMSTEACAPVDVKKPPELPKEDMKKLPPPRPPSSRKKQITANLFQDEEKLKHLDSHAEARTTMDDTTLEAVADYLVHPDNRIVTEHTETITVTESR